MEAGEWTSQLYLVKNCAHVLQDIFCSHFCLHCKKGDLREHFPEVGFKKAKMMIAVIPLLLGLLSGWFEGRRHVSRWDLG